MKDNYKTFNDIRRNGKIMKKALNLIFRNKHKSMQAHMEEIPIKL